MNKLRVLNFEKLITLGVPDISSYTYDDYRNNGHEHRPITGYCISCEKQGCHIAKGDPSYQLTNISHGAHSSDIFCSIRPRVDIENWHKQPILFLFEAPSLDYGIYKEVSYQGYKKHPSKDWYWIHEDQQPTSYPIGFKGGEYGQFVLSVIQTFKLSNVYITNLVKCSLNNEAGKYKGLSSYAGDTVKNCYSEFLEKEITLIKPRIIFAIGSALEAWVKRLVRYPCEIQGLPHPVGRRRGFRNEHYKAVYFWSIARALHKSDILDIEAVRDLASMYLERYDGENPESSSGTLNL